MSALQHFRQNNEGGSSTVNALGGVKLGTTVRNNNAINIGKLNEVQDVLPVNRVRKNATTSQIKTIDFVAVNLQSDFACIFLKIQSNLVKVHNYVKEQTDVINIINLCHDNDKLNIEKGAELYFLYQPVVI